MRSDLICVGTIAIEMYMNTEAIVSVIFLAPKLTAGQVLMN